jgi:hypothetical protein
VKTTLQCPFHSSGVFVRGDADTDGACEDEFMDVSPSPRRLPDCSNHCCTLQHSTGVLVCSSGTSMIVFNGTSEHPSSRSARSMTCFVRYPSTGMRYTAYTHTFTNTDYRLSWQTWLIVGDCCRSVSRRGIWFEARSHGVSTIQRRPLQYAPIHSR